MGDAGGAGRCAGATSAAPGARGGQHGGAGPAPLGEGGGRQGPAAAHTAKDSPPPPLDGTAADPLLGTVRTKSSGLHQPSMGREGGQGSSDRGGGQRAPVGELAAMGSVGGYCRPRQGGATVHGPPSCLAGGMTVKNFIPGGLQIQ